MTYTVEDVGNEKVVHYLAFFADSGASEPDDMTEEEMIDWSTSYDGVVQMVEFTFLYIPAAEVASKLNELPEMESLAKQYTKNITESKAWEIFLNYYGVDNKGEYLPIEDVNEDTPYGCYWCNGYWQNASKYNGYYCEGGWNN